MNALRSISKDRRLALLLAVTVIVALGYVIQWLPGDWTLTTEQKAEIERPASTVAAQTDSVVTIDRSGWRLSASASSVASHAQTQVEAQTRILFEHGLALLQKGEFAGAVKSLEMVVTLSPQMPEAFVNLGFALYELEEFDAARGAFLRAIDLNPGQGNAYYGVAIAYEALGEVELALGAMRSYLHIADGPPRFKARARAAIWEWEQAMVRRTQTIGPSLSEPVSRIESSD